MFELNENSDAFRVALARGVDRGAPEKHAQELAMGLARNGVLCVRFDAALSDPELQALARCFGPIKEPIATTSEGESFRYSETRQIIDAGFVMTDEIREKLGDLQFGGLDDERPGLFETFHCDDTFTAEPAGPTVLHARELPPSGGGPTLFLDMRAAFDLLEDELRARIGSLTVRYAHNNGGAFPPRRAANGPADALEEVHHPLVRTHSLAGSRSLFVDLDRALAIDGMPLDEGRALLQELQDHAEAHAPQCQHDWQDHDVLVWDNASVQHKARGDFKVGEPRRFWRYMVEGGRPV